MEEEQLKPIESEEELKEVNQIIQTAMKIKGLIEHPGWKEVLMPFLDKLVDKLTYKLLTEQEHIKVIRCQETIKGLEKIFTMVNYYINAGKAAEARVEAFESAKKNE